MPPQVACGDTGFSSHVGTAEGGVGSAGSAGFGGTVGKVSGARGAGSYEAGGRNVSSGGRGGGT